MVNIDLLVYIIIFFLGLSLGSFLNSWVWRTHENIKILTSRSICTSCRRQLVWYENMPIFSYLFLHGKCRTCKKPIPKHFIFVELGAALIFLLVVWQTINIQIFSPTLFLRNIIFSVVLIIIFIYDWLYQEILPEIVWLGAFVGLFLNIYLGYDLLLMLIGLAVAGGFFGLQFAISKSKWIGGGDVRMGVMMGVWLGWPAILLALFLAYMVGTIISLSLIFLGRKQITGLIPFGTYLSVGTFTAILWGQPIITWYTQFLE